MPEDGLMRGGGTVGALLLILCAIPAHAAPRSFPLTLTLPSGDYAYDSLSVCGGQADTLSGLKWLEVYGYRFGSGFNPGIASPIDYSQAALLGRLDVQGLAGQPYSFLFEATDSTRVTYVELFTRALDPAGNAMPFPPCSRVLFAIPPWAEAPVGPQPGLLGEYYDNEDLTGLYASRVDSMVYFDWNAAPPMSGMGEDTFSIRWTGTLKAPFTGSYAFRFHRDDGVRLWIDGYNLISGDWGVHTEGDITDGIYLAAGDHEFRLEYRANVGDAVLQMFWTKPGAAEEIVPKEALWR